MADNANILRDAVTRIPIWTGEGNDVFTPDQWLQRIEKARVAAGWDDAQTMSFVYVSLRGDALSWYEVLERSGIAMTYAGFAAAFRTSYAPALTARTAIVNIHEIKQGPAEKVVAYYTRVIRAINDIEALLPAAQRADARIALPDEIIALNGFNGLAAPIRNETAQNIGNVGITIALNHVGMQMFVAGLKSNFRDKMLEAMPATLWDAFQQALGLEKIHQPPKNFASMNAISEENDDTEEIDIEIDAVSAQLRRLQTKRSNFAQRPNNNKWTNNNSNNKDQGKFDMKDAICRCCKKKGHMQDVCFTRIKKGLPCVDAKGQVLKNQPPRPQGRVNEINSQGGGAQNGTQPNPTPPPQGAHGFTPPQQEGGYWTPYLPNFP